MQPKTYVVMINVPPLDKVPAIIHPLHGPRPLNVKPFFIRPPRLFLGYPIDNATLEKLASEWGYTSQLNTSSEGIMYANRCEFVLDYIWDDILEFNVPEERAVYCEGESLLLIALCSSWDEKG